MTSFGRAAKKVDKLKRELRDNAEEALDSAMDDVANEMRRQLRRDDTIASGRLLTSITTIPAPRQDGAAFTGQEIRGAPYWKYVEFGTGIYTSRGYSAPDPAAPFQPIYNWVRAKGIVPYPFGPYNTQRELAEAIAQTLSTGTPQQKFARPAWRGPRGREHVINVVGRSMQRAVDRAF